jgi:hypothetical protein
MSEAAKTVKEAQAELERLIDSISSGNPERPHTGGGQARPVYVIVSSQRGLTKRYGQLGFNQVDRDLQRLSQVLQEQANLETITIYVDDRPSLVPYALQPVDPTNPWQIKMLIDELDNHLSEQGREIRYLLIVGGDAVIPFHRLPNPVDDQDVEVPSDNPYASRDTNYLLPERAIGRMPDGDSEEIDLLHTLIQTAVAGHLSAAHHKSLVSGILGSFRLLRHSHQNGNGLGYSASIWRKASREVFALIGEDHQLRISPPLTHEEFRFIEPPHFSYFNLHGIEDGADWYGQRDSLFPADYPLFPVALRPDDLNSVDHGNSVVFTEACYGANIVGKNTRNSIALRFLALRALGLVGSTKVAYGSIAPPLLGADLIGRYFWEGLQRHMTVGEALKYAKVSLARDMQERQGYLDGEDQKTLISFVLYGDPSLSATGRPNGLAPGVTARSLCPNLICHKRAKQQKGRVSDELVAKVKGRIEVSLPHMAHAQVRATPLTFCNGQCSDHCHLPHGEVKVSKGHSGNWTFTLEKDIPAEGGSAHHQVVKVTVDGGGHILKMAVSK